MKKNSVQKIVAGGILGVMAGVIFLWPHQTEATWFDDNYGYRQKTTIGNTGSSDVNKKIKLDVDTATLITDGKMNHDCSDTRFTDVNGKLLQFYLDSAGGACDTASTDYYVLLPTINGSSSDTSIYMYYGNPLANQNSQATQFIEASFSPTSGPTFASEEKGPSPVLYWKFDEVNGTASDATQYHNDGVVSNATLQSADQCISGTCMRFDGLSAAVVRAFSSDKELSPGTGSFTVSAWFRHSTAISGEETILARHTPVGRSGAIGYSIYMQADGTVCGRIKDTSYGQQSVCTNNAYNDNTWHFIEFVKTATTSLTLYLDSRKVAEDTTIHVNDPLSDADFSVGADVSFASSYWNGFIDEVKIYNYAKSTSQIQTDYVNRGNTDTTSASLGAQSNAFLSNGLIGYWRMDETSWATDCSTTSILDSSGNAKNGQACPNASAAAVGAGKFGNGGIFDNTNDYVEITSPLLPTTDFTYSIWANVTSNASDDDTILEVLNNGATAGGGNEIQIYLTGSNTLQVSVHETQLTGFSYTPYLGNWSLITVTRSGNTVKVYVNGIVKDSGTVSGTLNYGTCSLLIGTDSDSTGAGSCNGSLGNYLAGSLDDLRIYNQALSDTEVTALYEYTQGPVAWWKLDEKSGTTAYDRSGNNYSTSFTGSPVWVEGKYGGGLQFDGTTQSLDATIASIGSSNTLELWIYPTGSIASKTLITSSKLTTNSSSQPVYGTCIGTAISLNVWTHITVISDGASICKIYQNGVVTSSSTTGVTFGSSASIGASSFSGIIDDVKIYNYPLSSKQVVSDMNAGHPAVGSPVGSTVAYWNFDEGYGTTAHDKSINQNDLTLSNASWTSAGKFGKAWNGDGTSWLSRANDDDVNFAATEDFSISMWFKTDSTSPPGTQEYLLSKSESSPGYRIFGQTDGDIVFGIDDDTTWTPGDKAGDTGTNNRYDGSWHHVVATKTGTTRIDLYIDGKLIDSDTTIGETGTLNNTVNLYIGDRNGVNGGDEFNGDIDDVKIYRYVLNADQVKVEYNQGKSQVMGAISTTSNGITEDNSSARENCVPGDTTSCSAPIGEWKFDEGIGTTANDTAGGSNNGTISGPSYTTGKVGKGLLFNGGSDVVTVSGTLSTKTVSFWVNPSSTTANLIDLRTASTVTNISVSSGVLSATGFASPTIYVNGLVSSTLVANSWQYVTVTTGTAVTANAIKFGTIGAGTAFTGKLDAIKFYDYARTPSQIAWDYNRGAPVGWWRFDECQGTTAYDSSRNVYNGTITPGGSGNTTVGTCNSGVSTEMWNDGTTGKFNTALGFDGTDDYVQVSDISSLRFDAATADYSLFAWVKRTTTGTEYIISKEDADNDGWRIMFDSANHIVCSEDNTDVTSTLTITDTNWHHVGCVISRAGNGQIYIDGSANGTAIAMGSDAMATTSNIRIGTRSYTSTSYFNGLIDDIQVYNYSLTSVQVKNIYNQNAAIRFGPSAGSP